MAITLTPSPKFTVPGHSGSLAAGFKVHTYEPGGTITNKPTYTTSAGSVANTNPVILDARGEADIWWDGFYNVVVKDADDVTVYSVDNYGTPGFTGITDNSTSTQVTITDTSTTFAGDVVVQETFTPFQGVDVASATVLTLGVGNTFDVTGTTTITSIASKGVGTHVTLQFDGALTLTHHATDLILPEGVSIQTRAGDIGVFYEYATGDWRCVSYKRSDIKDWGTVIGATTINMEDADLHIVEVGASLTLTFASSKTNDRATIAIHNNGGYTITPAGIDNNSPTLTVGTNVQDIVGLVKSHGKITLVGLMDNQSAT